MAVVGGEDYFTTLILLYIIAVKDKLSLSHSCPGGEMKVMSQVELKRWYHKTLGPMLSVSK